MRKSGAGTGGGGGGFKFGLIGPASKLKKSGGAIRPIGAKPAPRKRPQGATTMFDTGDSDDNDSDSDSEGKGKGKGSENPNGVAAVNRRLAAISAKQEKAARKEYEEALAADPSVFDYDRAYDGMQASRESKAAVATTAREKEKRQPKYIGNLLKQAKLREVESDRIYERKLQKEREEQDKLEGEATMKFVTSAYKKKLMEQKKWELQQQLEEEREQREDVTKTGMSGFYSNLITKNIAMGGDVEKSANSAFTTGSKRYALTDKYEMHDDNTKKSGDSVTDPEDSTPAVAHASLDEDDTDAPSAKMVDPRAVTLAAGGARRSQHKEQGAPAEEAWLRKANVSEGADTESLPERTEGSGDTNENGDAAIGRRRREDQTRTGDSIKRGVDVFGAGKSGGSKRVRTDDAREGDEVGVGSGEEQRPIGEGSGHKEGDEGGVELSEVEKEQAAELEKIEKAAAAKAKKEAAVKAARERFLARKKM